MMHLSLDPSTNETRIMEGNNKRALPQIPESVARSPMFSRSHSQSNSPLRSSQSSPLRDSRQSESPARSPLRSPMRSQNPYEAPAVSPVSSPHRPRRFDTHEVSPSPGRSSSPVRRLQFASPPTDAPEGAVIDFDNLASSTSSGGSHVSTVSQPARALPQPMVELNDGTSPFDDSPSVAAPAFGVPAPAFGVPNKDADTASIVSGATAATLTTDEESTSSHSAKHKPHSGYVDDEFDDDYEGHSLESIETLSEGTLPKGQQPRRNKSMSRKQVQLVRGNLVLDCPVPSKLYSFLPRRDSDEYVYMRYTACTSDPDDFADAGFTIRPAIYERDTEICVCITMYNEDEVLFTRTLHAVFKNIAYLCQRSKSKVWGPNGWKKVVVSIVADGRTKVNPRVLDCLAAMGVYQDGVAKNFVNGEEVQAHIFEYTAQVSLTPDLKFQGAEKNIVPVQMIFCLKERNAKKINSHRWMFNALCPQLNPNVVVLLDVGTRPANKTLYYLWKAFDEDSNVGGACGEIKTMTGPFGRELLNPLVAAQNFEYKISNILDKPFESVFGYISVLPGALSAYRYRALQNHDDGTGPLASYFKGEKLDITNAGIFEKNMYLAEDRILCWELVAKRSEKWVLKYVKSARGETDVPDTLPEFISQRRRWLNGALFAALYSQTHFRQIWATDHSFIRKLFLHIEFLYQFFQLLFTFFSISNFYLAFYFVAGSVAGNNDATIPHGGGLALFLLFKYICVIAICAQFVLSLGNRPQGAKALFGTTIVLLSLVTAYTMIIGIYFVAKTLSADSGASLRVIITLVVSLLSTYGLYTIMSILYMDPWHMITSAVQYFLLLPGYVCTLQIYAFCNTHDVTWGTKGDNEQKMDLGAAVVRKEGGANIVEVEMPSEQVDIDTGYENALHALREQAPVKAPAPSRATLEFDYYREVRSRVVLIWMVSNLLLVMLVTQFCSLDRPGSNVYLQIILWSMAVFALVRALGSTVFLLQMVARSLHKMNYHTSARWRKLFKRDAA